MLIRMRPCRFTSSRLRSLVDDHDAAAEAKEKALSNILKVRGGGDQTEKHKISLNTWCGAYGHHTVGQHVISSRRN